MSIGGQRIFYRHKTIDILPQNNIKQGNEKKTKSKYEEW